ncbi:MAG: hypothetical protein AB7V56_16685 [Candidatus Nitrosocosmicus sp.]
MNPTENKQIHAISISKERNMLIAERFISDLVTKYRNLPVSTDGGSTGYPSSCLPIPKTKSRFTFFVREKSDRTYNAIY